VIGRRVFLSSLAAAALLSPSLARAASASPAAPLRFLRVRGRTLLVEIDRRRVLVDPCFAADLGAGVLFDAAPPSIEPDEVGDIDLLLVSAREPGAFDAVATAKLRGRTASCFVGDEETARILRHQGYRRVRVVVAGDRFTTRGVTVSMSPSRTLWGAPAVGFHLARSGRTLWHAAAPPPLDVDAASAQFAQGHSAEVVAAFALGVSFAGVGRILDREDALLLAGLAHARYALLLDDDTRLSVAGGLFFKAAPGSRRAPPGVPVRPIVVEGGRWYRVLEPSPP
jgi:hypothetical protein